MTTKEAESIIQAYSSFYANINERKSVEENLHVFSSFDLPWSPAKIKLAFLTLAEDLVAHNEIDSEFELLKFMYGTIDGTFKEEADGINNGIEEIESIKDEKKIKVAEIKFRAKYGINPNNPDSGLTGEVEFQNFISDLTGGWNKNE